MPTIELEHIECGQLMNVLANATGPNINWAVTNPLLMKIGEQLRLQQGAANGPQPGPSPTPTRGHRDATANKETGHG